MAASHCGVGAFSRQRLISVRRPLRCSPPMPTLNFKGKAVIETYHHTVPHHRLEFDEKLSLLAKGQKPSLDGNLIIEGDNLLALNPRFKLSSVGSHN